MNVTNGLPLMNFQGIPLFQRPMLFSTFELLTSRLRVGSGQWST